MKALSSTATREFTGHRIQFDTSLLDVEFHVEGSKRCDFDCLTQKSIRNQLVQYSYRRDIE